MSFSTKRKTQELLGTITALTSEHIYANEVSYHVQRLDDRYSALQLIDKPKKKTKASGLWNLFVPEEFGQHRPKLSMTRVGIAERTDQINLARWRWENIRDRYANTDSQDSLCRRN